MLLNQSNLSYSSGQLSGRGQAYIIKSMGKPDKNGIIDVDITLVDSSGRELADSQAPRVVTRAEMEAADKLLGVDGERELTPEQIAASRSKLLSNNKGLQITQADGTVVSS